MSVYVDIFSGLTYLLKMLSLDQTLTLAQRQKPFYQAVLSNVVVSIIVLSLLSKLVFLFLFTCQLSVSPSVRLCCDVMRFHVASRHVVSCHVMSCHVMSCHVMSCDNILGHVLLSHAYYILLRHVTSRHANLY